MPPIPAPTHPRLARERRTVQAMIRLYCEAHHGRAGELCTDCAAVATYANQRLERCPYQHEKPTCANCPVHCYRAEMRHRIREIMRYAGPRLILRHPVLTVRHLLDGRKKVGPPPKRQARSSD